MEGEEGQKCAQLWQRQEIMTFVSILSLPIASLPLNLWDDFPVNLSKNPNIMELPRQNFLYPGVFDGHLSRQTAA